MPIVYELGECSHAPFNFMICQQAKVSPSPTAMHFFRALSHLEGPNSTFEVLPIFVVVAIRFLFSLLEREQLAIPFMRFESYGQ